jgi:hypothetical protein
METSKILTQILISLMSSGVILGLFVFIIKKYIEKLITHKFDIKLSNLNIHSKLLAEIKKEFLLKSINIYEETSKLSFKCLMIGRRVLSCICNDNQIPLEECWTAYANLQKYLENQSYIDQDDYKKIHNFKNQFEIFCSMCQRYSDMKENDEIITNLNVSEIQSFWNESIEISYQNLQNIFRLFSIKKND